MYIPISQRQQTGQASTGKYVPIAQRKVTPIDPKVISYLGPKVPSSLVSTPISELPTALPKEYSTLQKIGGAISRTIMPSYARKLFGFGKTVQEEIAKSGGSVGLALTDKKEITIKSTDPKWQQIIQRTIFGDEPVESFGLRTEKFPERAKEFGIPESISKPTAPFAIGLITALDFTGLGGSKNVIKVLSKADDIPFIIKTLKRIGVADDLVVPTAQKLSKIVDEKQIKVALERISELQKTTKTIQKGKYVPIAERASFTMKDGALVKLKKPVTQVVKPVVKIVKPIKAKEARSIFAKAQKKFISTTKSRIQKGIQRTIRTAKNVEARRVKSIKERGIISGRLKSVKIAGEAKLKGFIDKARIIKGKVIRKEELKGFKNLVKERSYWKKTVSKITNKAISIKNIKKDIFEFAKKVLPENVRGKLLASVAKAETRGQLASAFKKIINERNIIIRKGLTTNLSKIIKGIEKLPLKWQDKIIHEMDKIAFKGMTEKTIARLTKLREFLSKQPEAELLFGRKTLKKTKELKRLDKQNIADMSLRDLIKLDAKINYLSEQGKLAKKLITDTKKIRQEVLVKKLQTTSKNIDIEIPRTIGAKLTKKQKLTNGKYQIAEQMNSGYMNYVSSDIGFEVLDNNVRMGTNMKTFKIPFDDAYNGYKEMNSGIVDNYFDFKKVLEKKHGKFENHNMERIMIHATLMQKGGREKLIKSGYDKLLPKGTTFDNIKLSKAENELYQFMRNVNDELHPHIDKTLRSAHNRRLGKVDNYFSWQTDFNNSDEVFKRLENDYILSSRTQQGFTKKRIGGVQPIKLDAENVFLKHVNDSSYFINTEDIINDLGKIARDDGYGVAVGKNGQKWVQGWIDLQARKNIPAGYKPTVITTWLNNIGAGVLGFRISPIAKQPIAKITSSALLGKHTFKYDPQFFKNNLSPYIKKISKQQKFRTFDDPAYTELAKNKKLAKWQEIGYQGIKWVDGYTADSVWYAAYRKYFAENNLEFSLNNFKKGISNKSAVEYADLITRRTQGSGEAKDLARMLVGEKREIFRSILKFQTFILNESYLIPHDAIGVAARTEKDYPKAIGIIMAYMTSGIAEDYVSSGIAQLFSSEKWAKEEREKKFMNRIFDSLLSKIPGINNLYSIYKYDSTGMVLTDMPKNAVSGGRSIIQGKKPETKIKGLSRVIESIAQFYGVAGIGQAGQAFRRYGIPEEKKKSNWSKKHQ